MTGNVFRLKLALAVIGLLLFAGGARYDNETLRWAAIVVIALAFLLRFVKPDTDQGAGEE